MKLCAVITITYPCEEFSLVRCAMLFKNEDKENKIISCIKLLLEQLRFPKLLFKNKNKKKIRIWIFLTVSNNLTIINGTCAIFMELFFVTT